MKNVAASVRQRLLNLARSTDRPFDELLQHFAMERFLYRLSRSPHGDRFVLKGALMLTTWNIPATRPTRDIDLLDHVDNDVDGISAIVRDVCTREVEHDGMEFDEESVQGDRIAEEAEYTGVRVRFQGRLGTARVRMQIDVGFGDAVVPGPDMLVYPTLLDDLPPPRIAGYTRESMIAEKFHTMVLRGILNSRMRDFYDVWSISRQFAFEGAILAAAIRETFKRRGLGIPARPLALTAEFVTSDVKAAQWRAFVRKSRLGEVHANLATVVEAIRRFLGPVSRALHEGEPFGGRWEPPGLWSVGKSDT